MCRYLLGYPVVVNIFTRYLDDNETCLQERETYTKQHLEASVHDGTQVPATWDWNQKLSRISQIKGNI